MIRISLIAFALVAASTSCKQAKDPPKATEVLTKVRALATKICACPDRVCADALLGEWNAFTAATGGSGTLAGVDLKMEEVDTLIAEDERVKKCVAGLAAAVN